MNFRATLCVLFVTLIEVNSHSNGSEVKKHNRARSHLRSLTFSARKIGEVSTLYVHNATFQVQKNYTFTQSNAKQMHLVTLKNIEERVTDAVNIINKTVTGNVELPTRVPNSTNKYVPPSKENVSLQATPIHRNTGNGQEIGSTYNDWTTQNPTFKQKNSKSVIFSDNSTHETTKEVFGNAQTSTSLTFTTTNTIKPNSSSPNRNFPVTRKEGYPSSTGLPSTKLITSKKPGRITPVNKKSSTTVFSTLSTKSKHHSKGNKSTTSTKSSITFIPSSSYSKPSPDNATSQSSTIEHIVQTTPGSPFSSPKTSAESQNTNIRTQTTTKMAIPNLSTKHVKHENPKPSGKTKILINEIAISQSGPDEQFIELKVSSDYTHDLQSYEVVVFSGIGEVLSTIDIHGTTGKPYNILANEDIHVNIRKELQKKKSIAVAVYHRTESASVITLQSKGVMDAIVLTAYDGRPSDQLMQNLMKDNVSPFHVSASALANGGTISRCAENHVRDTQDFMEMSEPKATRGFRNVKCPRNRIPNESSKSLDNIQLTLIVVTSCLGLFLVLVLLVVIIMKRKQRQIKLMQDSIMRSEYDDEEVVLKMASVNFESNPEDPPTFNNDVYLKIKF